MRWKSTYGITFWSTRAMTFLTSPDWIDLSAFTASRTSDETVLMSASGALAVWAAAPNEVKRASAAAASQPIVRCLEFMRSPWNETAEGCINGRNLAAGGEAV